jgi:hypothetical protein
VAQDRAAERETREADRLPEVQPPQGDLAARLERLSNPSGLARRRFTLAGRVDESLQRDLSWHPTSSITQWEYGNLSGELAAISDDEASDLIERFREKWSQES